MAGELLTGHRSWLAYDIAQEIVNDLVKGRYLAEKDALQVRGIIQIKLEEKREG